MKRKVSLFLTFMILILSLKTTLNGQIPNNDQIALYELNKTYGDSSGLKNHGTNQGSIFTRNRCFVDSNAVKFDGVNDYINIGKVDSLSDNLNNFSVSLWFKSSGNKTSWESMIKTINNGSGVVFSIEINRGPGGFTKGYLGSFLRDDNGKVLSLPILDTKINDCEWHHYVLVVDDASANKASIYLDGVSKTVLPGFAKDSPNSFSSFNHDLVIGAGNNRGTIDKFFKGSLDDIFIFKGALDTSEVERLYRMNCGAKCFDTLLTTIKDTLTYIDTSCVVINDTNYITIFDTTRILINDTNYVSIFDTTRVTVYDTLPLNVYDTTYVSIWDTLKISVFDTIIHTDTTRVIVYDTLYRSICDTLILVYSDSGCIHRSQEIRLYPNSAKDELFVEFGEESCFTNYRLRIHDAVGRLIYTNLVSLRKSRIELFQYAQGTYLLSIFNAQGGRVGTRRFTIKR